MKAKELRDKSLDQLGDELLKTHEKLFSLRLQKSTGQVPKPHLFKETRRSIALINTLISERCNAVEVEVAND